MRNPCLYLASAALTAGLFVGGCSKSDQPATPATPTTPAVPAIPAAPTASADQATTALDKVKADIANKDWTSADTDLKAVEATKDQLTPELQKEVDDLRATINAGKAVSTPTGLPGLPH